jgi:hypothetical protein
MTIIARKLENKPDFIFDALEYFDNVNNTYSEIKKTPLRVGSGVLSKPT